MDDNERVNKWLRGLKAQEDLPGTTMVTGPLSMLRLLGAKIERLKGIVEEAATLKQSFQTIREVIRLTKEENERLQAYPAAVDKIRSYYPTDVFPDDGDTGAKFARSLCDQIHAEAAEAAKGEPDG